jgi:hypothetical protein
MREALNEARSQDGESAEEGSSASTEGKSASGSLMKGGRSLEARSFLEFEVACA